MSSYTGGDSHKAILLYQWNTRLAQALYPYIQGWEVCLRNKLDGFLSWKYTQPWPYDDRRFVRQLTTPDRLKLNEVIDRQTGIRHLSPTPTDAIVAALSAGFWVSMLSRRYEVPFSWHYNIRKIFPHSYGISRAVAWDICNDILILRNRIAHHEPIIHLDIRKIYENMRMIVLGMCEGTHKYCKSLCTFEDIWSRKP